MQIGQVVKNILNELSCLTWHKITAWGGVRWVREVTVDPQFSGAVIMVIEMGFNDLKKDNSSYKDMNFILKREIYLQLVSDTEEDPTYLSSKEFFNRLEIAITQYVKSLSLNWTESTSSMDEIVTSDYFKKNRTKMIILERPQVDYYSSILLRQLAIKYDYYDKLDITVERTRWLPERAFIIGKKSLISTFFKQISSDLTPSYYEVESKEIKPSGMKLENLCIQQISHYSSLYPNSFSLYRLPSYDIPEKLLKKIEEASMEHVQSRDEINKYKDKIIIYKTTSSYLCGFDENRSYLLYPKRKELKVGIVKSCSTEKTCQLLILQKPNKVDHTIILSTSKLKYANFKLRLPLPMELDKIKQILKKNKSTFSFNHRINALEMIEAKTLDSQMNSTHYKNTHSIL